jgi:hypothetical protein
MNIICIIFRLVFGCFDPRDCEINSCETVAQTLDLQIS